MEGSNLVALVKSHHGLSHRLDVSGNIVSLIGGGPVPGPQRRHLPVFGIGAGNDHANKDMASFGGRNVGVSDCN